VRAAVFYEIGGPEVFRYEEVPDPVCRPGGVVIDVAAAPGWRVSAVPGSFEGQARVTFVRELGLTPTRSSPAVCR